MLETLISRLQKTLKKTMNKEVSRESTSTIHSQKFSNKVHKEPTENELNTFFTTLSKCASKPAILSVVSLHFQNPTGQE